ncbi:MAG TPA: ImcF-related family protein [Terracidiphilus sp.]|nr:ImcF-related family protein [Terracidiphilus sp.]
MLLIIVAALVLILSIVLAWLVGPLLGLAGTALLVLRILLIVIGAGTAGFILYLFFKEKRQDAAAKNLPGGTDLDTLLRDAEHRLATAQRTGPKSIDTLPLLYILGESNSAKTTSVLKSGFDPELLAGQVYRDQDIVATPVINLWYAHNCVFAEAGNAIRQAPQLWHRVIRKSRPKATRSAMGKQAPVRAAVVCVSSELFLGPTATDASLAAARSTNQMLRDLAQQLGTEVPVYVIITKLDRIPYFAEYTRNLNEDEVAQPLGAAFPRSAVSSGLYAERAMAEATAALDRLFFSLGEFRLELLSRENDPASIDPDYEFPREMRKLRNNLAGYLVELTRPSHLNANPYLRGFYFSGVRAHMVQEMVAAAAQQFRPEPAGAGATRMFSVEAMRAAAAAPVPQTVTRKQAQWCFLPQLFPGVILGDRSALAVTSNSARTHTVRRVAFASICIVLLALLVCFTISWAKNSALERRIATAANALPTAPVPATMLASTPDLASLDQLRAAIVQLEAYQQNGAPLMYRWGLYHGDSALAAARRIYFERFRSQMLSNTQINLITYLSSLPAQPPTGADYSAAYDPLKAYLITTSNPDKSTVDFLAPVLMQYWQNGRALETDQQKNLAYAQFAFYSHELAIQDPYSIQPDSGAVTRARTYLAGFGGFERIYQQMLTAAGKQSASIDFNRLYPGSAAAVVDGHIVPGAFTAGGFTFMQDAINHPDRYFSGEVWVLGSQAPPSLDRATLTTQLESRYTTDFTNQWRDFLHAATVVHYRSLADAATKLQLLTNNNSPLLALLYVASHNTAVANPNLAREFQPPQHVVAPASLDVLIGPGNQSYINGLLGLQGAVAQVAQSPNPNDPNAVAPIIAASTSAHTAASQTAQSFTLDPTGHVDQTVLALLQAPINSVDEVVRGRGPAVLNGQGAQFCSAFTPLMAKFPFAPNSSIEASPSEVAVLLQPGAGSLWQLYDNSLKTLLVRAGSQYVPVPNAPMKINPDYVRFFNRAAALSNSLYPPPGVPGLNFTTKILPSKGINSVTVGVDTQQLTGSNVSKQFTWSLATSQQSQLIANYGTGTLPLLQFSGPWAVFHLMDKGRAEAGAPGRLAYPLEISNTPIVVNGTPLVVYLELSGQDASLLMPGGLSGIRCVSTIAH